MEELTSCGAVDAYFVDLGGIVADVFDVAEDVAETVLGDKVADVCSETHVGYGVLVRAPCVGGETFEEDEAFAVDEVGAEFVEDLAKSR